MKSIFDAQFWQPIVDNARDMLKIDLFVVDSKNVPVYVSKNGLRYGGILTSELFTIQTSFKDLGNGRLEWLDNHGFSFYAIKIENDKNYLLGYIVLGPIILSKRLSIDEYRVIAILNGEDQNELFERLEEIRVVSHLNLDAILNTINALLKVSRDQIKGLKDQYQNRQENILESMFRMSFAFANAESGSLMLFDDSTKTLVIYKALGIDTNYLHGSIGLDEGISGKAFKEQKSLILRGQTSEEIPERYLKRCEIKESIVMPFTSPTGHVQGVLNVNYTASQERDLSYINRQVSQIMSDVLQGI